MTGRVIRKGYARTSVEVANIPESARDDDIATAAMAVARETRGSLFGWTVKRDPWGEDDQTMAVVDLHTD